MNNKRKIPHSYERNIVEIRNEYTDFLKNILTPLLYEGLKSTYNYSKKVDEQLVQREKISSVKNPGVLAIFQLNLQEIPSLNSHQIEMETNRIKEFSLCSEWFDDLVKAVIKSNIILLTFTTSKEQSYVVKQKYHEGIRTSDFIHKCYIESAKVIYNNPELFWHEFPKLEIKKNQRKIYDIIKNSINEAIRKSLPIKLILTEFLQNDYIHEEEIKEDTQNYEHVKAMVNSEFKLNRSPKKDNYIMVSLKDNSNNTNTNNTNNTNNKNNENINNENINNENVNNENNSNLLSNISPYNPNQSNINLNNQSNNKTDSMVGGEKFNNENKNSFEEISDEGMTDIDSVENKLFDIERGIRKVNDDEYSNKKNDEINVIKGKTDEKDVKNYFADFTK